MWMRGGLIGCFTLTMNERVVDWMERNREELTRKKRASELLDQDYQGKMVESGGENKDREKRMDDFVYSVHDKSQLLYRLAYLGYFEIDEKQRLKESSSIGRTFENINVLIGSIVTSFALSLCLTPLDIVCLRHKFVKSELNQSMPKQLRESQTLTKTVKDIFMKQEGKGLLIGMTFSSTFIRYLFILIVQNMYINSDRKNSKRTASEKFLDAK